jgi:hypothetical protein
MELLPSGVLDEVNLYSIAVSTDGQLVGELVWSLTYILEAVDKSKN